MRFAPFIPLALSFLSLACGSPPRNSNPTPRDPGPEVVKNRSSLRTAFDARDVNVVGISVAPDTKRLYVLDATRGLYELTGGTPELVANLDRLVPLGLPADSAFTDLAALGNDQFAMTALNDGFLLDLQQDVFDRYFCYVPGELIEEMDPTPIVQMTRSLTFDAETGLMYAQPQTFANDTTGEVVRSQIGQFALTGGEGFGWLEIEDVDFLAGAISAEGEGKLLLGEKSNLHSYDMTRAGFVETIDLTEYGITAIEAMTRDPATGHLLIVDGLSDELIELDLR